MKKKKKKKKKKRKEGICKVLGRSVTFSAFYADLCLCHKSVIITLKYTIICGLMEESHHQKSPCLEILSQNFCPNTRISQCILVSGDFVPHISQIFFNVETTLEIQCGRKSKSVEPLHIPLQSVYSDHLSNSTIFLSQIGSRTGQVCLYVDC